MPLPASVRRLARRARRVRRPLLALFVLVIVVLVGYLLDATHHDPAPRPAHSIGVGVSGPPVSSHTGAHALFTA